MEVDTLDGSTIVGVQHNVLVDRERFDSLFLTHSSGIGEVIDCILSQHDNFASLSSSNGIHQLKSVGDRCEVRQRLYLNLTALLVTIIDIEGVGALVVQTIDGSLTSSNLVSGQWVGLDNLTTLLHVDSCNSNTCRPCQCNRGLGDV